MTKQWTESMLLTHTRFIHSILTSGEDMCTWRLPIVKKIKT